MVYMEYYSATKKTEILLFMTTWMGFEDIMLCEMPDRERNTV